MKVILATTIVPFVEGGDRCIVDWLEQMLLRHGHDVEVFRIPFHSQPRYMLEQMLALRLLDLSAHGDRLIAIRTPSYLLRHPCKVLWFIHHHRGAYDLWGTAYQDIPNTPDGLCCRQAIFSADQLAFAESRRVFTNSRIVSGRLRDFNGVDSEVLYPPLLDPERFQSGPYGDYAVYISRLVHHKRQHLAIESMRYTRTPVRLVVAGSPDVESYSGELAEMVERYNLGGRVTLRVGWLPEREKQELLAGCLAALYVPFAEDSYGYAGLEAQHSAKALVTTSDSGGPLELVVDEVNGLVVEPSPRAIAAELDRLYENRALARRMGEAGRTRIAELGITWDNVLARLLA